MRREDEWQAAQTKRLYSTPHSMMSPPTVIHKAVAGLHLLKLRCRLCTWPRADAAFHPGWWATRRRGSWWQVHRRRRGWRWLCREEVVRLWEEGKADDTQPAVSRMHLEIVMNKHLHFFFTCEEKKKALIEDKSLLRSVNRHCSVTHDAETTRHANYFFSAQLHPNSFKHMFFYFN